VGVIFMDNKNGIVVVFFKQSSLGTILDRFIPIWVTPNHLTVLRMLGALIMLVLGLSSVHLGWLIVVGVITGFSDKFDGWLARRRCLTTELGALLDPLADKFWMILLFIVLWWRCLVDWPLLLLTALTEAHAIILPIMIILYRWRHGKAIWPPPQISPNCWGKVKTAWLVLAMGFIFIGAALNVLWLKTIGVYNIWVGMGLGIIAIVCYFRDWRTGIYM